MARLSKRDISRMRELRLAGWLNTEIAKVFGCSTRTVIRHCKGLMRRPSKLTPEDASEIRASDLDEGTLAETYGVSSSTIRDIRQRRTWK